MYLNRNWAVIALVIALVLASVTGCQQLSKIIKPKSSSSGSSQSSSGASGSLDITACKFVTLAGKFRNPVKGGTFEDHFFSIINCPVTFSGLSFTGASNSAADWCNSQGGAQADCARSFECKISGTVSKDKKKLDTVSYSAKMIKDDRYSKSGKFEMKDIPYYREEDIRTFKSTNCMTYHIYYDLRGETIPQHIVSLDTVIYNSPDYSALTRADYIWSGGDGLYLCFKLLNCDVN